MFGNAVTAHAWRRSPRIVRDRYISTADNGRPLLRGQRLPCLVLQQALDGAPHVEPSGVGRDINQRGLAQFSQADLLALHHGLVLDEGSRDLAEELLGRLRIVLTEAVRGRPEVEARRVGLRGQAVEQAELQRTATGIAVAVSPRLG